jgi:hypothetical protein
VESLGDLLHDADGEFGFGVAELVDEAVKCFLLGHVMVSLVRLWQWLKVGDNSIDDDMGYIHLPKAILVFLFLDAQRFGCENSGPVNDDSGGADDAGTVEVIGIGSPECG